MSVSVSVSVSVGLCRSLSLSLSSLSLSLSLSLFSRLCGAYVGGVHMQLLGACWALGGDKVGNCSVGRGREVAHPGGLKSIETLLRLRLGNSASGVAPGHCAASTFKFSLATHYIGFLRLQSGLGRTVHYSARYHLGTTSLRLGPFLQCAVPPRYRSGPRFWERAAKCPGSVAASGAPRNAQGRWMQRSAPRRWIIWRLHC